MAQITDTAPVLPSPSYAPGSRILVTGAAGGLGQHLTARLRQLGFRVRALDRMPRPAIDLFYDQAAPSDDSDNLEWIHFDYSPGDDLSPFVQDCVAVIHTAATVSLSESFNELRADNVTFVEELYEAAARANVLHFVHISCASVYRADRGVHTEDSPVEGFNGYEQTKIASESALTRHAQANSADESTPQLPYTILRPALLYGPGCTSMAASMVTIPAILGGMISYLPGLSGGPRTNWCHIEDALNAVITVLGNPDAFGRCFNVADNAALSFGEVLTAIADAYGLDVGPSVPFPNASMLALVTPLIDNDSAFDIGRHFMRQAWKRVQSRHDLKSPLRPRLDRSALFYVDDDSIVIANELQKLGWKPIWPSFQRGIIDTIRWYQEQDWVPRFDRQSQVELLDANRHHGIIYTEELHGFAHVVTQSNGGQQPQNATTFQLELEWPTIPRLLAVTEGHINGSLTIDGLVHNATLQGISTIRLLPPFQMTYEFGFVDENQNSYRFCGTRKVRGLLPLRSPGQLDGHIINHRGECIATLTLQTTSPPTKLLPLLTERLRA